MKTTPQLLILTVAAMAAVACTTITPETNTTATVKHGVPGGTVVQTSKIHATVTGIDAANRHLTLVTRDGKQFAVKAGPEVVNFTQIRIGDQLKVTLTEELVVRMAKPGEKTADGAASVIGLAPVGAKPGVVTADTVQVTATVTAIDLARHKATVKLPDGTSKTFSVRPDVDLTKRKLGDKVVIRATEVLAILVEKP